MRARRWGVLILGAVVLFSGCDAALPEPESAGARLYSQRCGGCHRLYGPGVLKFEMWKLTLQRMQGEMARRGARPLTQDETTTLLDYLQRHSS